MGMKWEGKTFIQRNISPRVTRFYSKLGYVNRDILANNLRQIKDPDSTAVLNKLKHEGLLKQRFDVKTLQDIQPFMIKAVAPSKVDALFPGSEAAVKNISSGMEAGLATVTRETLASQSGRIRPATLAMIGGLGAAAVIGGVVCGAAHLQVLPVMFGAGTVYGLVSTVIMNKIKDPNSMIGKICALGTRVFPVAIMGYMATGIVATCNGGGMFWDVLDGYIKDLLVYGIGAGIVGYAALTARDIRRAKNTNNAAMRPLSEKEIVKMVALSNLKVFTGINYMAYRTILYSAFTVGALAFHFSSPIPFLLLTAGLAARVFLPKLLKGTSFHPERVADKIEKEVVNEGLLSREVELSNGGKVKFSAKKDTSGKINIIVNNGAAEQIYEAKKNESGKELCLRIRRDKLCKYALLAKNESVDTEVNCDQRVEALKKDKKAVNKAILSVYRTSLVGVNYTFLHKIAIESSLGFAVKWAPLLALTIPFAASPLQLFFDLATIYTGFWTLYADIHSGISSVGTALNTKRSVFNVEDAPISDAIKNNINLFCARMCAYMKESERNICKIVNSFIQDYEHAEIEYCGGEGENLYGSLDAVRALYTGEQIFDKIKASQKDIYESFRFAYNNMPDKKNANQAELDRSAQELAKVLETLGDSFYPGAGHQGQSYYQELIDMMEKDKKDHVNEDAEDPKAKLSPDMVFNLEGEESYVRQAKDALKIRGLMLLETARNLRVMAEAGEVTHDRLSYLYKKMLGVYSIRNNHFFRKFEYLDDKLKRKTDNLATPETHMGDTLYQVWNLDTMAGKRVFKGNYVPSTLIRVDNPDYDHKDGQARYIWIRREDYLDVLGVSQAMSSKIKFVENTPAGVELVDISLPEFAGHPARTVKGFYSNDEMLRPNGLIGWDGTTLEKSNMTWIAGEDTPQGFKESFREWAKANYKNKSIFDGLDYEAWSKLNGSLWYIDAPRAFTFSATDNYNVSDENYIVINSERQLQSELRYTAEKDKLIRVVNYEEWAADLPNPGFNKLNPEKSRPISAVKSWDREDAPIAIRYRTKNGEGFCIPYKEDRESFVEGTKAWGKIKYGLIKTDKDGKQYIEAYSEDNRKLGIVKTGWPIHMHPASDIAADPITGCPRIELDVFPDRIGMATWLVADYGGNYINGNIKKERPDDPQLYNSRRYVMLDFDNEAKKEFWPNFMTSIQISKDKKRIGFKTISPNCETFPFPKTWAGIRWSKEAQVLEVDSSGDAYINKANNTWSPKKDADHGEKTDGGILLIRKNGIEKVISVNDLPSSLSSAEGARRVIRVEKNEDGKELIFNKLRIKSKIKDNPDFVYSLPRHLYDFYVAGRGIDKEQDLPYLKLKYLLDEKDVTAGFKKNAEGTYDIYLYDENGKEMEGIKIPALHLRDNEGKPFLQNRSSNVDSLDSFYHSRDNTYNGTEEYKPRFIKMDGEIKLILTRVEKIRVKADASVSDAVNGMNDPEMFFAKPTSATKIMTMDGKEKWVPLSLSKPIKDYKDTPNVAKVAVKISKDSTRYFYMPISKDLPKGTLYIEYDNKKDKFVAFTKEINHNEFTKAPFIEKELGEVSPDVANKIMEALSKRNISDLKNKGVDVKIDVVHTRNPKIIDGEYQSVVHGQRQHGTFYKDETFPAAEQAQFRDEFFYGIANELFSEAFPPNGEPRSVSVQRGKTNDYNENDQYTGKPIENGTQFVGNHKHLFEMVEVIQGLPEGTMIAMAPMLDRSGGYEKISQKPNFIKLTLYCREKGWLSGVSEDEQGVLALALALGYSLKYQLRVTGFESQPNTYNQVNKQDNARYNTAMALAKDVQMRQDIRQVMNWFVLRNLNGTFKQKFEHFLFRTWYLWPKAELSRQFAPAIFMATDGKITPYIIDPYFTISYFTDFFAGAALYANVRKELGRNKEYTGNNSLSWSFLKGPAMNQSFLASALRGAIEYDRKGWQYGSFVTTALEKQNDVPREHRDLLNIITGSQVLTTLWGIYRTLPISILFGNPAAAGQQGYFLNEFWSAYAVMINLRAKKYITECESDDPDKSRNSEKADSFEFRREFAVKEIDKMFEVYANEFLKAYRLAVSGDIKGAREIFTRIVSASHKHKDMNFSILAEIELEKLGMSKDEIRTLKAISSKYRTDINGAVIGAAQKKAEKISEVKPEQCKAETKTEAAAAKPEDIKDEKNEVDDSNFVGGN